MAETKLLAEPDFVRKPLTLLRPPVGLSLRRRRLSQAGDKSPIMAAPERLVVEGRRKNCGRVFRELSTLEHPHEDRRRPRNSRSSSPRAGPSPTMASLSPDTPPSNFKLAMFFCALKRPDSVTFRQGALGEAHAQVLGELVGVEAPGVDALGPGN